MSAPLYHLSAEIPLKSLQYLEWLGLEARTSGGLRLSKATILRALLNVAMRLDIDVRGLSTQSELEARIWAAMVRTQGIYKVEGEEEEENFYKIENQERERLI